MTIEQTQMCKYNFPKLHNHNNRLQSSPHQEGTVAGRGRGRTQAEAQVPAGAAAGGGRGHGGRHHQPRPRPRPSHAHPAGRGRGGEDRAHQLRPGKQSYSILHRYCDTVINTLYLTKVPNSLNKLPKIGIIKFFTDMCQRHLLRSLLMLTASRHLLQILCNHQSIDLKIEHLSRVGWTGRQSRTARRGPRTRRRTSAVNRLICEVVQSRRRPLLEPSPG